MTELSAERETATDPSGGSDVDVTSTEGIEGTIS